jgi:integrase
LTNEEFTFLVTTTGKSEVTLYGLDGRDRAMLYQVAVNTGLRASEVCRLEVQHLDLANRKLTVRIKGGRWGDGFFSVPTRVRLRYWLYLRRRLASPGVETVFVSVGGERRGSSLTPDGLRAIFRQMAAALGMRHFSPHSLRRSMACICLENGASSRVVQLAGRWRSISMVETYSRALSGEVVDAYLPTAGAAPSVFSGGG